MIPVHQTMTLVHGPSIQTDEGNKNKIEIRTHSHRSRQGISKPSTRAFALTLVIVGADVVVIEPGIAADPPYFCSLCPRPARPHVPAAAPLSSSFASSGRVGTVVVGAGAPAPALRVVVVSEPCTPPAT